MIQGNPVFAGIDPDTQHLLQLGVYLCRTGEEEEEWESSLFPLRDQQKLSPECRVGRLLCEPGVEPASGGGGSRRGGHGGGGGGHNAAC